MENKLTPYDEAYYRVSFETAKLLKQAGFDKPISNYYNPAGNLSVILDGNNHMSVRSNSQFLYACSAPLIEVAKEWCYQKGYAHEVDGIKGFEIYDNTQNLIGIYPQHFASKETDIHFIKTACTHIIETQTVK